ncbi:hypothetical protein [Oleiharenicola sp. Vm1]|uniref:hypothetical protein n=1 Tax=Oleiharenicola sp. Vm1 TaxID=3398393 RepID=UPI0039F61BFD
MQPQPEPEVAAGGAEQEAAAALAPDFRRRCVARGVDVGRREAGPAVLRTGVPQLAAHRLGEGSDGPASTSPSLRIQIRSAPFSSACRASTASASSGGADHRPSEIASARAATRSPSGPSAMRSQPRSPRAKNHAAPSAATSAKFSASSSQTLIQSGREILKRRRR